MTTSSTEIANRALEILGADVILDLNTDTTPRGKQMRRAYQPVLRRELRKHPWNFAKKRIVLAPDATAPAFGFDYAYTWPSDAVRILPGIDDRDWQMEGRKILTDTGTSLNVAYVAYTEDTSLFDDIFIDAFAAALAMDRAAKITQSGTYFQMAETLYKEAISQARKVNAFENAPDEFPETDWLRARY